MAAAPNSNPRWTVVAPLAAIAVLALALMPAAKALLVGPAAVALAFAVFAAVHHAEVVAHKVGEPFGTLVLAIAVTVIEVALIVSMMLTDPEGKAALARDTVFAAVMIVCNGIVGACLLVGGMRHRTQDFQIEGANAAIAVLAALTTLVLVVPNVTTSVPGPVFSSAQLVFASICSLVLYGSFVFIQTVRHRDYFLPVGGGEDEHADPPTKEVALTSAVLLVISLIGVVGLAKVLTPSLEYAIDSFGVSRSVVGIAIAGLVLLPEGIAAVNAARANRLQTSLNLALGSALATIGLTIPAVAAVSIYLGQPLVLGLGIKGMVLLVLTLLLGIITLGTGRTTVLQGIVHLVVFAAFVFFAVSP